MRTIISQVSSPDITSFVISISVPVWLTVAFRPAPEERMDGKASETEGRIIVEAI